jgi:hypothetical protein
MEVKKTKKNKLDKRVYVECHPRDPDGIKFMKCIDLDNGGYEIYYEYWREKKGVTKEDTAWNEYIRKNKIR